MPRIECRPDQVFPELLEARLLIPGELPDDAPELVAVVPLTWDWLGWGKYAFAIPRGNSHVHMNLTCSGPAPDQFGLHFSLYGRDYAGGFLKPVRTLADPPGWEFAINVPGQSLAKPESTLPLTIVITPAPNQAINPDEPYHWPLYGAVSGWASDSSDWDSSSWDYWGELSAAADELGQLNAVFDVRLPPNVTGTFFIDIDRDGQPDIMAAYDPIYRGLVLEHQDFLQFMPADVDDGDYPATVTLMTSAGLQESRSFTICIDPTLPLLTITAPTIVNAYELCTVSFTTITPPVDPVSQVSIDWGDQSSLDSITSGQGTFSHVYTESGSFFATVAATSNDGTSQESILVQVSDALLPRIIDSQADVDTNTGYTWLTVQAVDAQDQAITEPSAFEWTGASIRPGLSGNSVLLEIDGVQQVSLKVTDSQGRSLTAAYEFLGPAESPMQPVPMVAGKNHPDPTPDEIRDGIFRLLYGDKGKLLLKAFEASGGTIQLVNLWTVNSWLTWDYWTGNLIIQIDPDLNPVQAAQELMARLVQSTGYPAVRNYLFHFMGHGAPLDEVAEQAYLDGLNLALQQAAGTAATLAELYIKGATVFNQGLDIVISVFDAADALKEGKRTQAILASIPLLPTLPSGGKVVLKGFGTADNVILRAIDLDLVEKAAKYAELVRTNQWDNWDQVGAGISVADQKMIRDLAKALGMIEDIPVDKITKYADFSSVAIDIPGVGKIAQLPKVDPVTGQNLWKAGRSAHDTYLNRHYFNGTQPQGTTWHHMPFDGKMMLVPRGLHKVYNHKGGMSPGHWGHIEAP